MADNRQPVMGPYNDMYYSMLAATQGLEEFNKYKTGQLMLDSKNKQIALRDQKLQFNGDSSDTNGQAEEERTQEQIDADNDSILHRFAENEGGILNNTPEMVPPSPPVDYDKGVDIVKGTVEDKISREIEFSTSSIGTKIAGSQTAARMVGAVKDISIPAKQVFKGSTWKAAGKDLGKGIKSGLKNVKTFVKNPVYQSSSTISSAGKTGVSKLWSQAKGNQFRLAGSSAFSKSVFGIGAALSAVDAYGTYKESKDQGMSGWMTAANVGVNAVKDLGISAIGAINPYAGIAAGVGADALENWLNSLDDDTIKSIGESKFQQLKSFTDLVDMSGATVTKEQMERISAEIQARVSQESGVWGLGRMLRNAWSTDGRSKDQEMLLDIYGKTDEERIVNIKKGIDQASKLVSDYLRDGKTDMAFQTFAHAKELEELYGVLGRDSADFSKAVNRLVSEDRKKSLRELADNSNYRMDPMGKIISNKAEELTSGAMVPETQEFYKGATVSDIIEEGMKELMVHESTGYNDVNTDKYPNSEYGRNKLPITDLTLGEIMEMQGSTYGTKGKQFGAVGKYQFTYETLFGARDNKDQWGLLQQLAHHEKADLKKLLARKFTPELQDELMAKYIKYNAKHLVNYLKNESATGAHEKAAMEQFGLKWDSFNSSKYPNRQGLLQSVLRKMRTSILKQENIAGL